MLYLLEQGVYWRTPLMKFGSV